MKNWSGGRREGGKQGGFVCPCAFACAYTCVCVSCACVCLLRSRVSACTRSRRKNEWPRSHELDTRTSFHAAERRFSTARRSLTHWSASGFSGRGCGWLSAWAPPEKCQQKRSSAGSRHTNSTAVSLLSRHARKGPCGRLAWPRTPRGQRAKPRQGSSRGRQTGSSRGRQTQSRRAADLQEGMEAGKQAG